MIPLSCIALYQTKSPTKRVMTQMLTIVVVKIFGLALLLHWQLLSPPLHHYITLHYHYTITVTTITTLTIIVTSPCSNETSSAQQRAWGHRWWWWTRRASLGGAFPFSCSWSDENRLRWSIIWHFPISFVIRFTFSFCSRKLSFCENESLWCRECESKCMPVICVN